MIRSWRRGADAVGVLAVLALAALPAGTAGAAPLRPAAGAPRATQVAAVKLKPNSCCFSADRSTIEILLSAPQPADPDIAPETLDPASIRLTVQAKGSAPQQIIGSVRSAGAADSQVKRSAMLALDTSASMTPARLSAAKQAAYQFLSKVDKDVLVGLVTFGDPAVVQIRPTKDRTLVRNSVQKLQAAGDTAMYEAVVKAAAAMGSTGSRSIVMLTDGVNDDKAGQTYDDQQARKALTQDKNATIDFTGVIVGNDPRDDIDAIAGKQAVVQASDPALLTARLNTFFDAGANRISTQLHFSAPIPAALAGQTVTMQLTAATTGGQRLVYLDNTSLRFPAAGNPGRPSAAGPRAVTPDRRLTAVTTPIALLAIGALFVGLSTIVFIATGALTHSTEQESQVVRRLAVYSVTSAKPQQIAVTEQSTRLGDSALARSAVGLMARLARTGQLERALDSRLEAAGLPVRTAEWMLLHVGTAVGVSLLLLVASRGAVVAMLLGLVLGLTGPWLALGLLRSRRESKFLAQLPDTLQLLAGSLAAGYSLPQAMDSVVREARPPISAEFNRALIEARLGMPPEDALDGIAGRTGSRDFSWIVLAIRIQREVGGNLAELLSTVADTLRERQRLRRQVKALSAEGKLSGFILGALPVVFGLYLVLVRPEYISPLVTTPFGLMLLSVGAVLLVLGSFWMAKVIKINV